MTQPSVPYVPGAPPVASSPTPARPAAEPPRFGPVVGESVDLAHELAELRKLHIANLLISGCALLFALFAAGFSGYIAYYLYGFVDALHRTFG